MIKAQITVYASLTFAIVISFICTIINSVRMSVIYYETDMASRMSAESVFGLSLIHISEPTRRS